MKVFYLLKNGEITEGDAPQSILENWDSIPEKIEGVPVLAVATSREAIDGVRKAIFADEELLVSSGKIIEDLTPADEDYLKERGY